MRRSLGKDEVHVWTVDVVVHAQREDALAAVLERAERDRAARFHFVRDRIQYVVAHGTLRELLAAYAGTGPASLRFETGPWGKPALTPASDDGQSLAFSLSHSGERVLIAVARDRRVGVDVERWASDIVYDELAAYCFSPAEQRALRALPPAQQQLGFFACWSRKEAYLKALGIGVSQGLDHFDVTLAPGEPARVLDDRHAPGTASTWTMRELDLGNGYSGAVVADGPAWRLRTFTYDAGSGTDA